MLALAESVHLQIAVAVVGKEKVLPVRQVVPHRRRQGHHERHPLRRHGSPQE